MVIKFHDNHLWMCEARVTLTLSCVLVRVRVHLVTNYHLQSACTFSILHMLSEGVHNTL